MVADRGAVNGRRRVGWWGVSTVLALVAVSLCAGASLLAVARFGDSVHRREIELVSFTPLGLPLALVGLLAAGILGARHGRVVTVLAMVPSAALVVLHASWLAPLYVGSVPDAGDGSRLVVMTQNFESGDAGEVAALVEEHGVDVLVLTDAPPDQVEAITRTGVGIALRHTTLDDGTGSVVWSRYPITSSTFISDGGDSRVVTLDVPQLGELDLIALHPSPPYQEGGDTWVSDWSQVVDFVSDTYGATVEGNVVVAGDFNATGDHPPVRALHDMGLRDSAEQLNRGWLPTWPANGLERRAGVHVPLLLSLDHLLTSGALVPTELLVTDAAGGDHRAVIATLAAGR